MGFIYPVSNFIQKIFLRAFADWQVIGRENVLHAGPLIIVANHQSNFDPTLLSVSMPRRTCFLAKESIFRGPLVTWFLRQYGAFPLNREGANVGAYRWALRQLELGHAIVVFPEGTRNPGAMKKAHTGVARLAWKTGAPLLPVGITGTAGLGHWMRAVFPTGTLRVNIGTAFSIPSITGRPNKEVLGSLTDMIMQRVAALLPASLQGVYRLEGQEAVAVPHESGRDVQTSDTLLT